MSTFSSTRIILAVSLVLVAISTSLSYEIKPVCYTKIQKCCFNYVACGKITRKVNKSVDCSFKKCYKVCKPHCIYKTRKVPFNVCGKVWKTARVCSRVKVHHDYEYVWKTICKPKRVYKVVCVKKYRIMKRKVCEKKCYKVCKNIEATCIKIHVLSFPKFCPTLKCYKFTFKGSTKEPAFVVGKKSKLVKIIDGKRTIKH